MKRALPLLFLAALGLFEGCKKDKNDPNQPPATGTASDKMKDSVFLYAKEDYYWNTALPDYSTFNPRGFTGSTDLAAMTTELNKLSQYAINSATGLPYEYYAPNPGEAKYSFIDDGTVSSELNGVSGDFGFAPFFNSQTDLRVKYVYAGSPADQAGIKRGYQIIAINGTTSFDDTNSGNISFIVNAYSASSSINMTLKRPDGSTFSVTLQTATYNVNPILFTKVYDLGNGKKAGYIVFNSFVSLDKVQSSLNSVFSTFQSSGVTDLIVDLRYNGGGYVETAEYMDNLIAPAAASGKTMYTAYYNATLQANKETLLKYQTRKDATTGQDYTYEQVDWSPAANTVSFGSSHPLSLSRVIFIVTQSTASASELTINCLRPYLNVLLVGNTTYGKPVGFFDIDINKYIMYTPEFETKNSAGQGGYYTGMVPGSSTYPGYASADDVTKDFGDTSEKLLASALSYISTGNYTSSVSTSNLSRNLSLSLSADQQRTLAQQMGGKHEFTGMLYKNKKR